MSDACTWVTAAEPALGWQHGRTLDGWLGARASQSADLVATNAVAQAILGLTDDWHGTAGELLEILSLRVPEMVRKSRDWPTSPRGLSGRLRYLAPDLRRLGLDVIFPLGARNARERIITIRQGCNEQDRQDRSDSAQDSTGHSCPIACPADSSGHQQDSELPPDSLELSDLSGSSCPSQPRTSGAEDEAAGRDPEASDGEDVWTIG
jgi:hypothetical protein